MLGAIAGDVIGSVHEGAGTKRTTFPLWARDRRLEPYGSWGNGSAMRVSPVGFAVASEEEAWAKAAETAGLRGVVASFEARFGVA